MWFAFCQKAELVEGTGIGRRQRIHGKAGSRRSEVDQVVTAYEPGRLLSWRNEAERIDGKPAPRFSKESGFAVWLEPEGSSTRVRLVWQQDPAGRIRGMLLRSSQRQVAQLMEKSLERLRMVVTAL